MERSRGRDPGSRAAGRISRASTSAGIYNAETREQLPGSGGEHHYVLVADGSDIPRALKRSSRAHWLNGLGWFMLGGTGQLLERSVVDSTVGSPERLVFEGAPVLVPPGAGPSPRRPVVTEGETIDTKSSDPAAHRGGAWHYQFARRTPSPRSLKPEAAKSRTRPIALLPSESQAKGDIDIETARRFVEARHEGKLMPSLLLEFDDDEIGTVTVGESSTSGPLRRRNTRGPAGGHRLRTRQGQGHEA